MKTPLGLYRGRCVRGGTFTQVSGSIRPRARLTDGCVTSSPTRSRLEPGRLRDGALAPRRGDLETVGSVVDLLRRLLTDGPGSLLGLAPGCTGGCVKDWLDEQTADFRAAIELVVIDPSAPYASGIRAALPGVKIAVEKWHLLARANQMLTEVRQRGQPRPARA